MIVEALLPTRLVSVLRQVENRRRSVRCCQVIGMIAFVTLFSPTARADFVFPFAEDWESGSIDSARWNSWGVPSPVLQSGGNAIGNLSLDPNGDGSFHSGVVSADVFSLSGGVRVSIDAYIESAASWSELTFGLANTTAIDTNPNLNLSALAEVTIDADTQGTGYKFFTRFDGDGGVEVDYSVLAPELFFDAWHTYVFDFAADGSAQVLVDGVLAFETAAGFYNYSINSEFSVLLGGRSYQATVNLYDSISVTKVPEPTTGLLLGLSLLGVAVRRRV
ncbi:MAG: PEP-CTERM sorting domain-containing protein [Myxococcota bacterium]